MDWSLVLASQGISALIEQQSDSGYALVIEPGDLERARDAIRLFRLENRRFLWRPQILSNRLLFDWTSLAWVFLITFFFLLSTNTDLRTAGIMSQHKAASGEWWRLFTATWLHGDSGHLASNATLGVILLGLAMGQLGPGVGLLGACLAGVGGNVLVLLVGEPGHQSLGASGVVMGALGLLACAPALVRARWWKQPRMIVGGLLSTALLFALFGLAPNTDVLAHFGGFMSGILIGVGWTLMDVGKTRNQVIASLVLTAMVIIPWLVALS